MVPNSIWKHRQWGHLSYLYFRPPMVKTTKSVMHSQCYSIPTVTFPATERHHPPTSNKLYCLVSGAQYWEWRHYVAVCWRRVKPENSWSAVPPRHPTRTWTPSFFLPDSTQWLIQVSVGTEAKSLTWQSITCATLRDAMKNNNKNKNNNNTHAYLHTHISTLP